MSAGKEFPPVGAKLIRVGAKEIRERKKGRRYSVRFRCYFEDEDGNEFWQYSPFRVVEGRKSHAEDMAGLYRQELERMQGSRRIVRTVGEFADEYQAKRYAEVGRSDSRLSPLTPERDKYDIGRVKEYWGGVEYPKLTAGLVIEGLERMREDGVSLNSINRTYQKLSQICEFAIGELCISDSSLLLVNPCSFKAVKEAARKPKPKRGEPLEQGEAAALAQKILEAPRLTGYLVCLFVALVTGMRRGEVLGLVWDDVDIGCFTIHVRKQYASDSPKHGRRKPKTDDSISDVAIDAGTAAFLRRWRDEQAARMEAKGLEQTGETPVCSSRKYGFIQPNNFDRWRRQYYAENGLGSFASEEEFVGADGRVRVRRTGYQGHTLHDLRHTQATLLSGEADVSPRAVQDRLRHAKPDMTNEYTHRIKEKDRAAADKIGELLELPEGGGAQVGRKGREGFGEPGRVV